MEAIATNALSNIVTSFAKADPEQKAYVLGYLTGAADQKKEAKKEEEKEEKTGEAEQVSEPA